MPILATTDVEDLQRGERGVVKVIPYISTWFFEIIWRRSVLFKKNSAICSESSTRLSRYGEFPD
jgi:hypothetical protein